ncbi:MULTISPECIES: IS66 family insertion sequence element accessory protein TnpA [Paenibacillus]|uniref:Transposase n=1 Tax=Paenibacillus aceti TaxID=1820010 RepID=A0ABQ1WA31_9BACL|nr:MULTISPECIES: hypothetical protein [Paenibacillus]GGG20444.1 hypothetical protein GCM10010913_48360 [Paenibacillus aceti]
MTNKERRYQEWVVRIAEYQTSGLTMAAWCQTHSLTKEKLKYWIRKAKPNATSHPLPHSPRFVSLTTTKDIECSSSSLVVHIGRAKIELREGFNPQLLREVVQALDVDDVSC